MWWNKYIGIPYKDKGRDHSGVDCWGLAKLVYEEQFNINLPSFSSEYNNEDTDRIQELINQYTEGWELQKEPEAGQLVLFKVLGYASHIGVMISKREFIHSREGRDVVKESIDSRQWQHRILGYYKYSANSSVSLAAIPHPLKTERVDLNVPAGITVGELIEWIGKEKQIPTELVHRVIILIDGTPIDTVACRDMVLQPGQIVEYRALPGKSAMRIILTVAVMAFAQWAAPLAAGQAAGTAFSLIPSGLASFKVLAAQAALSLVGTALVNAIFPVRPPAGPIDPGTSTPQLVLTGGRNQSRPYGAVPVVLGQYRYEASLAASNIMVTNTDQAYLKMLLIWGYGPLSVQDIRVGANPLNTYDEVTAITVLGNGSETAQLETLHALYGPDSYQEAVQLPLTYEGSAADWITKRISTQKVSTIDVTLHFPEGLRGVFREGKYAGSSTLAPFSGEVQIQELDDTLTPVGPWKGINSFFSESTFTFNVAEQIISVFFPSGDDGIWADVSYPRYQWNRIVFNTNTNSLSVITGPLFETLGQTSVVTTSPSPDNFYSTEAIPTLPPLAAYGQFVVHDVLVYNTSIHSTNSTLRTLVITGASITTSGLTATVTSGLMDTTLLAYGSPGQPYYLRKDAFSTTISFTNINKAYYDVRVRRTNTDDPEYDAAGAGKPVAYFKAVWYLLTGSNPDSRAVIQPANANFALTALKIKATDQLNGSIESINALVTSICLDYTGTPGSWIARGTRNPASLFRYILQHPGNSQAISNAEVSSRIDLAALEDWHNYCADKGFTYSAVITDQRSILDILRDIAAAGRASPLIVSGKWTVVIDRPRTSIVQHFTPYNSYGFEGSKSLAVMPHALRINFINSQREYQAEELIVYNDKHSRLSTTTTIGSPTVTVSSTVGLKVGSEVLESSTIPAGRTVIDIVDSTTITISNGVGVTAGTTNTIFSTKYDSSDATIFEAIELPGVTISSAVYSHARFHLAQARLRPEVYTLNTDMEHIVCTRGDLVRVTHDVPMWGTSSGRIKTRVSGTQLELYEPVTLVIGNTYTIRIRTAANASVVRTLAPIVTSGDYTNITLTAAISTEEGETDNLFMLGINSRESTELVVLSIEPSNNLTAKLVLVDYSPEIYTADSKPIPVFDTNIQQTPQYARNFILHTPVVVSSDIRSDESVMEISGSSYKYKIVVPFSNPANLSSNITHVEARIDLVDDTSISWRHVLMVPISEAKISIDNVEEGLNYAIQLRYVSGIGFTGPWTTELTHVVVGKTNPPASVGAVTSTIEGDKLRLTWPKNGEIDVVGYEVREVDSGWGTDTAYVFSGNANTCLVTPGAVSIAKSWYIRALDAADLYSNISSTTSFTPTSPNPVTSLVATGFSTSSTGQATINITWTASAIDVAKFQVAYYLVSIDRPVLGITTKNVSASGSTSMSVTVDADWEGTATISVTAYDVLGNASSVVSTSSTKIAPSSATSPNIVIKGTLLNASWTQAVAGSLPIAGYEITSTNSRPTGSSSFVWKGSSTTADLVPLASVGANVWYLWTFDSAGKYSNSSVTLSFTIAAPNPVTLLAINGFSTTSTGQATVTFSWSAPVPSATRFPVAYYQLSINKPILGTSITNISTSGSPVITTTVDADWEDTATVSVTAVDILSNTSTIASINAIKTAASPATSPIFTIKDSLLNVSWTPATAGSLPIAGYQITSTNTQPTSSSAYVWKGSVSNADLIPSTSGVNTWYLWSYDSAGKYSATSLTLTYTVVLLGTVQNTSSSFTSSSALFKWTPPITGTFAVKQYNVTLSATGMTTVSAIRNTTDWEVPVGWNNTTATLTVQPVDARGIDGTSTNITLQHTVPTTVSPANIIPTVSGTNIDADWQDNSIGATQLPISYYTIERASDNSLVYKGSASRALIPMNGLAPATYTYNVYAYDYINTRSAARSFSYTVVAPPNIANDSTLVASFGTSSTDASLTISWPNVAPAFGLAGYEISYDSVVVTTNSSTITIQPLPSGWIGNKSFTIKTIDLLGNKSSGTVKIVTKSLPLAIATNSFSGQVIDNNVMLYWSLPTRTSLPVVYTRIKRGASWGGATLIGDKSGTFTTIFERSSGVYQYWAAAIDTDGQEGPPISISVSVSQPPDFIFNAERTSTFTGSLSNAFVENSTVVMPANATIQYGQHFIDADDGAGANTWATPQAQIDAGFPVYIQPSVTAGGYYEEVFDLGTLYGSSQITLTYTGTVEAGAVAILSNLTYSSDGSSYSSDYSGSSLFGVNIRYVKVRITVTPTDTNKGIYRLSYLNIRLDAKIKNDAGAVDVDSSHTNGTTANFNVEFVDVSSITLTPSGTTARSAVYDYVDTIINGSYSIVSNVCTITASGHGFTNTTGGTGQKVRLIFTSTSGTMPPNGVYTVTYISATQYSVAITTPNATGNVSTYSQGMRVYLFNDSGARATGTVSWAARGY